MKQQERQIKRVIMPETIMRKKIEDYAIVIGIDHYINFPSLRHAESDARDFADWLTSSESKGGRLPANNVRLFRSTPATAFGVIASAADKWSIERALSEFGVQGGVRVGRRLTFYFAGYSRMLGPDDVGLLMADAKSDLLDSVISLKSYRQFFQEFAPFNEVVFILDTHHLTIPSAGIQFQELPFTLSRKRESAPEVAFLSIGYHPPTDGPDEGRVRLTPILLDGLRDQKAAGSDGSITSTSCGRYAIERIKDLAAEERIQNLTQVTISQSGEIVLDDTADERLAGTLIVELPHWTAELSVFDSRDRKIPDTGSVTEHPPGSGSYQAEIILPKGVYQVQASLEDENETQFVLVHAATTATVKRDSWKTLVLKSAAPLASISISDKTQIKHAEEKSLKSTWKDHPNGDSRLFLFLRTEAPEKFPAFHQGLKLLNENGELVTDFSQGVKKKTRDGWMAFNAKLPSGYYVLRRGREGVRVRQQAIYLCGNWETHVFLLARDNFPSLSTMAMDMSRLGNGFRSDDAAAAVADSVLWSLRPGTGERGLVGSERLRTLLDRKKINPWVGILASYVLLRAGSEEGSESDSLLRHVLSYLNEVIPDHPDVQALHLKEDQPADSPFWNPPLLRAGLERVQAHATHFADTIPLDSLCDVVLDNFIPNTPLTAWRHLDRKPISRQGAVTNGLQPRKTKGSAVPISSIAQSLAQSASPALPVYKLSPSRQVKAQKEQVSPALTGNASAGMVGAIGQAALLQQVQALTATTNFDNQPESTQVNLSGLADNLLDSINPADVSGASGIPLGRAQRGLEGLRQRQESTEAAKPSPVSRRNALSADEQTVIHYAIQQQKINLVADDVPDTSAIAESDVTMTEPRITIEELAFGLQTEADRLLLRREPAAERKIASALAKRLRRLAEALLERANYIVVTAPDAHILYSNGAFLMLISPAEASREERQKAGKSSTSRVAKQRNKNQRLWEKAIRKIEPGDKTIQDPQMGASGPTWVFKRTAIEDEGGNERAGLYTFHRKGVTELGWDVLNDIAALMDSLSINSSMFAYSTEKDTSKYLSNLEDCITKLEAIVEKA